jgi:hypothetical protein
LEVVTDGRAEGTLEAAAADDSEDGILPEGNNLEIVTDGIAEGNFEPVTGGKLEGNLLGNALGAGLEAINLSYSSVLRIAFLGMKDPLVFFQPLKVALQSGVVKASHQSVVFFIVANALSWGEGPLSPLSTLKGFQGRVFGSHARLWKHQSTKKGKSNSSEGIA